MALSRRRSGLVLRLRSRRTREREARYLVEGTRSVGAALDARAPIDFAIVSPRLDGVPEGRAVVGRLEAAEVEIVEVEDREMEQLSDTVTHQGVLLVCHELPRGLESVMSEVEVGEGRVLALDGVQDPGNVGALVRVAAAFGLDGVIALDGTADPFGAKAVRASAGGLFGTTVVAATWEETALWLSRTGLPLLAAEAGGDSVADVDPGRAWILALGSERAGLRESLRSGADLRVSVPMKGGSESLNVALAGAILLYALTSESHRGGAG